MNEKLVSWHAPKRDFDWSSFWHEPGRITTFEDGRLSQSYYQSDRKNRLIELFDELVDQLSHCGRVLDVGCGNGAGAAALLEAADRKQCTLEIEAIDAVTVCPLQRLTERVKFRIGNAQQLDFSDQSFDLVLSCFCAEFCNTLSALKESHRVLKPGGHLAMLMYARESPVVSTQSRYVGVYQNGLQQLLETVMSGQQADVELIQKVLHHIEHDVPQPNFQVHLEAIVQQLMNPPQVPGSNAVAIDSEYLPGIDGQPNAYSMRSLHRRLALMEVIQHAAFDYQEARQLCRQFFETGFDDNYVIPVELDSALVCWFLSGERC